MELIKTLIYSRTYKPNFGGNCGSTFTEARFSGFWVILMRLLSSVIFLTKISIRNTIRVSIDLDSDHDRRFVGPDLGPYCLEMLSTNDKYRC